MPNGHSSQQNKRLPREIGSDPGHTGMTEIVRKTTRPTRTSLCRMVVLTAALEMFWIEEPLGGQLDVRMSSTYLQ